MEWRDEGVVLGVRRHGETSVIAEVMTPVRGRHLGIVRGGRSRKMQPVLQPGNSVTIHWRARLAEHMGAFAVEPERSRAARLMETASGLNGVQLVAAHCRLLPERDAHRRIYDGLLTVLDHLHAPDLAGELVLRFELAILEELGFGLDLTQCAATGVATDLAYVSPRTGRAVAKTPGAPYRDRLLALPFFLRPEGQGAHGDTDAIRQGFELTGFFLDRHVYEPRGLVRPTARAGFVNALSRTS